MVLLKLSVLVGLLLLVHATSVEEFCKNNPTFDYAPSHLSCRHGISCKEQNFEAECPDENPYLNVEMQKCQEDKPPNCRFDDDNEAKCPLDGTVNLPHQSSCRRYLRCINGERSDVSCPLGEHFSPLRGFCMDETKAECVADEVFCPAESREIGQFHLKASKLECGKYYLCITERTEMLECAPDLHFNEEKMWCESEEDSECIVRKSIQNLGVTPII